MPTTPDEPATPRRRLGRGGAAPAEPAAEPALAEPEGAEPDTADVTDAAQVPGAAHVPDSFTSSDSSDSSDSADAFDPSDPSGVSGVSGEPAGSDAPEPAPGQVPEPGPESGAGPEGDAAGEPEEAREGGGARFTVRLANFEGPFDLLLQLISKHKLDVTEVALSKVTNEFMAYIHAMGPDWDLDQTTEFLVVAATLLDLKAARLLPSAEVEDEADLALLEARDLLFARLLQYRAFKRIAAIFAERLENEALRSPRTVGLEPQHAELLPEVVLSVGPQRFARLAVKAMQPKPKPQVYVDHIHAPLVSVREQAEHVIALLRARGSASFQEITEDAADTLTVVARFLALLELYREKAVALDQAEALGALQIRWTGAAEDTGVPLVTDEFDQEAAPKDARDADGKDAGKAGAHDARDTGAEDAQDAKDTRGAARTPGTNGEQE
ncbi:ScpA family protein [Streptomyces sp. HPF1205]|uniref:segregation and condensation protein A n=1 Tax=Streptomyces sp. HPF1205 TaxID=2873262 RepID=UPI001CEC164C|nr:segregation/condensation protein A [Streptomyces sp. HPF1205]